MPRMIAAQQNSMIRRNHERDLSATPPNAIFDCLICCEVWVLLNGDKGAEDPG
jgi:hypothetical protein